MFTNNNTILVDQPLDILPKKKQTEFNEIPIERLHKKMSTLSVLLPYGKNPFFAYIKRINIIDVVDVPVVKLTFENTQGKIYNVECEESSTSIFAKYNKFINVGEILKKNIYFAGQDILGFPIKLTKFERNNYTGKLYDIITRRVNNCSIGNVIFASDKEDFFSIKNTTEATTESLDNEI